MSERDVVIIPERPTFRRSGGWRPDEARSSSPLSHERSLAEERRAPSRKKEGGLRLEFGLSALYEVELPPLPAIPGTPNERGRRQDVRIQTQVPSAHDIVPLRTMALSVQSLEPSQRSPRPTEKAPVRTTPFSLPREKNKSPPGSPTPLVRKLPLPLPTGEVSRPGTPRPQAPIVPVRTIPLSGPFGKNLNLSSAETKEERSAPFPPQRKIIAPKREFTLDLKACEEEEMQEKKSGKQGGSKARSASLFGSHRSARRKPRRELTPLDAIPEKDEVAVGRRRDLTETSGNSRGTREQDRGERLHKLILSQKRRFESVGGELAREFADFDWGELIARPLLENPLARAFDEDDALCFIRFKTGLTSILIGRGAESAGKAGRVLQRIQSFDDRLLTLIRIRNKKALEQILKDFEQDVLQELS